MDGAHVSVRTFTASQVVLQNGAIVTHSSTILNEEWRLEITASTMTIEANSRIDVSARGYLGLIPVTTPATLAVPSAINPAVPAAMVEATAEPVVSGLWEAQLLQFMAMQRIRTSSVPAAAATAAAPVMGVG